MNKKTIIVFDFDGTIADSVMVMIEIINDLAVRYGFNKIDRNNTAEFLKLGTEEMIRKLEIPKELLGKVMEGIRQGLKERSGMVNPVAEIVEVINILVQRGYRTAIVTSNKKESVATSLKKFQIEGIKDICAEASMYGKENLLMKLASDHGFNKADMVYIGDETRDIEAGRNCGMKALGVTWGLNGRDALLGKNPDWIVDKPKDLLEIFE